MRQALVLLLGTIALSSIGGAAAARIDWKSLPYFDYSNQRLLLVTDANWSGAHAVDASVFNPQPDPSWPKLKRQWIWSPRCGTAAQRVVFSKTILVPGVPLDGNLSLMYGPVNQNATPSPYVSATIQVNGIEIGRLHDVAHFPRKVQPSIAVALGARARQAFRHGPNTVTIRVERAALKKGDRCTHPAATSGGNERYVAISASLALGFGSDLQAIPPAMAQQVQKGLKNGDTVAITGTIAVKNNGPSTSLGGTVLVHVNADGGATIAQNLVVPNPPLDRSMCTFDQQVITCKYAELPAGAAATMFVPVGVQKVNTGFFHNGAGRLTLTWTVTGPSRDPGTSPSNNTTQTVVVMCVTGATDPACA